MYLDELCEYPNILAKKLIASQEIIDLLLNVIGSECPNDDILDKYIFSWDNIGGCITETGSYICIDTDVVERTNEVMKGMELHIYVIVNKDLMKIPSTFKRKGNRRDNICNEIDKLLADDYTFGKTKLRFKNRNPVTRFYPADGYVARHLIYECEDSSRVGQPR